jgi:hypothetical protein
MALDLAQGMEYLHTRDPDPVLHCDLTASNLLVRACFTVSAFHSELTWTCAGHA